MENTSLTQTHSELLAYRPTDEDRKAAEAHLEIARLRAAANLPLLVDLMTERGMDPTATSKAILDAAEFNYKVSGLAKKQEEQVDKGRFVFNINFQSGKVTVAQEKVIEGSVEDESALPETPSHVAASTLSISNDLQLDWE
jgi:hypothetical protein